MSIIFVSGENNVDKPNCSKLSLSEVWFAKDSVADGAKVGGEVGPLRPVGVLLLLRDQ